MLDLIQRLLVSVLPGDAGTFPSKDASTFSDLCALVSSLNVHLCQSFSGVVQRFSDNFIFLDSVLVGCSNQHTSSVLCINRHPCHFCHFVSPPAVTQCIAFSLDFSNILRSFCFLLLLYASLLSMCLSSPPLLLSLSPIILSRSLSPFNDSVFLLPSLSH